MAIQGFDILKCYEVLDIRPGATVEKVRKAYLDLAHVWDPAKHMGNPPLMHVAEEKRKELDAAYSALQAFLPDLSHGTPIKSYQAPVRPADAISDAPIPSGSRQWSAFLYVFLILLTTAFIVGTSALLWHLVRHTPPASSPLSVPE